MLILIAESKTMAPERSGITSDEYAFHTPAGEPQAARIIERLGALSASELTAATGLSASLAARLRQMIYEFPNKSAGMKAIEAFTGVVFRALDYNGLAEEAKEACRHDVRIVSSLYGLLRPDDIIKPYRLDFTAKAAPGDVALNSFWKKDVTIQLVRTLQDGGHSDLLNLLPADAAKCIDWKLVKRFAKVWKADFVEAVEGDRTRTPSANKLKTARGTLLRLILSERLTRVADLTGVATDDLICEGTPVYPDHLQFLC